MNQSLGLFRGSSIEETSRTIRAQSLYPSEADILSSKGYQRLGEKGLLGPSSGINTGASRDTQSHKTPPTVVFSQQKEDTTWFKLHFDTYDDYLDREMDRVHPDASQIKAQQEQSKSNKLTDLQ
jgi:hypothetical protein